MSRPLRRDFCHFFDWCYAVAGRSLFWPRRLGALMSRPEFAGCYRGSSEKQGHSGLDLGA